MNPREHLAEALALAINNAVKLARAVATDDIELRPIVAGLEAVDAQMRAFWARQAA